MNPCFNFEAIKEKPTCSIGRDPLLEPCGSGCPSYLPDSERQPCEVWSRVMGYHRPVAFWNAGKQQEHRDRVKFLEGVGHD